jgi:Protein of unknown function (DUF4231)
MPSPARRRRGRKGTRSAVEQLPPRRTPGYALPVALTSPTSARRDGRSRPPAPIDARAYLDKRWGWYAAHAWRSKTFYYADEVVLLIVGALIPAAAAFTADRRVPAALGVLVVVLGGVRPIFRWREDWFRFTDACAQLETERRLYDERIGRYDGARRDQELVRQVREIETAETQGWLRMRRSSDAKEDDGDGAPG